jgi:hypothetical protein
MCAWYKNLEPSFIERFNDLCVKLECKSIWTYLKRYNEEMLKVEEFLELIALKVLIRAVKEHVIWSKLHALLDKSLLKVKQDMKNYIQVEEADLL